MMRRLSSRPGGGGGATWWTQERVGGDLEHVSKSRVELGDLEQPIHLFIQATSK